jgi:hypothetical protein
LVLGFATVQLAAAAEVTFMPATTVPTVGFKMLNTPAGRLYVGPGVVLSNTDLNSVSSMRSGTGIELNVSQDLADELDGVLRNSERLAAFVDGTFVDAPLARVSEDKVLLNGLSKIGGEHLANLLNQVSADEDAPIYTVTTNATSVRPGDMITVDVFINNAVDLKAFQVRARATGATTGRLPVAEMIISKERPDYVFGTAFGLDAVDNTGDRMGGLIMDGATDVMNGPKYVGTFTFQTPAGVNDMFYVNVEVGEETLVLDPDANEIPYRVGAPAVVASGVTPRTTIAPTRTDKVE